MPMSVERSSLGTELKGPRNTVAHLHPFREAEYVGPLVGGQRMLVFAQHVGHLFEGETQFVRVDELGDQRDVFAGESVIQADEEAVHFPGDLFVVGTIHPRIVPDQAHSMPR